MENWEEKTKNKEGSAEKNVNSDSYREGRNEQAFKSGLDDSDKFSGHRESEGADAASDNDRRHKGVAQNDQSFGPETLLPR